MAELIDAKESDVPDERRLRLSLVWRSVTSEPAIADELEGELSIGLFVGEQPLFSPAVYERWHPEFVRPDYFYAEDYGCYFLRELWRTLRTGKRTDFEDTLHPSLRLVVSPDLLLPGPTEGKDTWFDVLAVIQHGGLWHGRAMCGSGPGVFLRSGAPMCWRTTSWPPTPAGTPTCSRSNCGG